VCLKEEEIIDLEEIEALSYSQNIQLQLSILQELIIETPDTTEWITTLGEHARELIDTFSLGVMEPFINEKNMWMLLVEYFALKRADTERMEQYYKSRLSWYLGSILKEIQPSEKIEGTTVYQDSAEKALIDLLRSLIETKIVPRTRPVSENELIPVYGLFEKEEEIIEPTIEPVEEEIIEPTIEPVEETVTDEAKGQPIKVEEPELRVELEDTTPLVEETTIKFTRERLEEKKVITEPVTPIPDQNETMEEKKPEEVVELAIEKKEKPTDNEPEDNEYD